MRVAYADPPYIGYAHYYGEAELDHFALIRRLLAEFPDGWALSCKTNSPRELLPLCPENRTRVCAWVKTWASYKPGVHPAFAWEPVLLVGGRNPGREHDTVRDWHASRATQELGFIGQKPRAFSLWLFGLFGLRPEDEFVDLFPSSGAVTRAWEDWRAQGRLKLEAAG